VTFYGSVPFLEIGAFYQHAELFLYASCSDTQGLVVSEAQALGLPVVAFREGGIRSEVVEGRTGFLLPPGDTVAMSEKSRELLLDHEKLQLMGEEARKFGLLKAERSMARELATLYSELLNRRGLVRPKSA